MSVALAFLVVSLCASALCAVRWLETRDPDYGFLSGFSLMLFVLSIAAVEYQL